MEPFSLYIHIPFCRTKCPYCDFNTYENIEHLTEDYINSLITELTNWSRYIDLNSKNKYIKSVFFGGGTPSYISENNISKIMQTIVNNFNLLDEAEISIECNPNDLSQEKLLSWENSNINRISIGAQSFSDKFLRVLGRDHDFIEISQGFIKARSLGFDNLNLDLIYGIPGQNMDDWKSTIKQALILKPDHISMYGLTIEKNTKFDWMISEGLMPNPDSDVAADMYEYVEKEMNNNGYTHYEISNWSLPGKESKHNLTYWYSQEYIGIGAGAHSFYSGLRFWNVNSPNEYINLLEKNRTIQNNTEICKGFCAVSEVEYYDNNTRIADKFILGLRLVQGINQSIFTKSFIDLISEKYDKEINELIHMGLLEITKDSIKLTRRGRLLANEVFYKFL